ncbi:hypothetical protein [Mycobacterium sp. 852013-51886_SCH5428379]|uniref:hypothetical protein n=1 Tax=Mycobacterium sp. 852013-51886_SCH5428379 TaxID=1834111 RepID=UPI001E586E65|nr:hypothetical protein [Mycobacterium sp. 852013-51886_SCH5428379]
MCQSEIRYAGSDSDSESDPGIDIWYPYPCADDFLCDDGVSVFDYDSDPDVDIPPPVNPDRPDIGLPGRPGDRPDRPDRPNRPGGGAGVGG